MPTTLYSARDNVLYFRVGCKKSFASVHIVNHVNANAGSG